MSLVGVTVGGEDMIFVDEVVGCSIGGCVDSLVGSLIGL